MAVAANQSLRDAEVAFLETLRTEYERDGYSFVVHPTRSALPDFFSSYEPDAVARKPDHSIAIEVKSRATPATQQSLKRISKLFEGRSDWQLRVVYMGGEPADVAYLPVPIRAIVLDKAEEVELLAAQGNFRAAFIFAWSLLEAALNSALPKADKRPRSPGTLVQTLAMEGLIREELDEALRPLVGLRNRVVHGDLTVEPSNKDVHVLLSAIREVLG